MQLKDSLAREKSCGTFVVCIYVVISERFVLMPGLQRMHSGHAAI